MKSRTLCNCRLFLGALALVILAAMAGAPGAHAQLTVSEMIVDMTSPGDRKDLTVGNVSEDTIYVQVEIKELINPGMPDQTEITHRSPAETGLLVSPSKLILGPGEQATLRMAVIERPDLADRVFQVTVKPVLADEEAQTTMIRLLVAYGVLVIVRPEELAPNYAVERVGQTLNVRNNGNTMVELAYGKQCDPSGGACVDLPTKRVYPGGTWQVALTYDTPVQYRVKSGGASENLEF